MPYAKKTNSPVSASPRIRFVAEPYHYNIPDTELLDDLVKVARQLGAGTVMAQQYAKHGRFSTQIFRPRFGSWNAALQRAQLAPSAIHLVTEQAMLQDIAHVAAKLGTPDLCRDDYFRQGKYSTTNMSRRFGSWTAAKAAAGLIVSPPKKRNPSTRELLENFEQLWRTLHRQPRGRDLIAPHSKFSLRTYQKHFGTFRKTLAFFIQHQKQTGKTTARANPQSIDFIRHKTKREVRTLLRYQVLRRDHFRCRLCGRSPATDPAVQLHVDHIHPWSLGGETIKENLQTLCDTCNGGKADMQ
jgi:5-methylcytosine-specific restriction endonuclease McrA